MEILKTILYLEDDESSSIYACDTIRHEGKVWLVPHWLESQAEGWKKPEYIICLDLLPHQKNDSADPADFVLNVPIPKSLFDHGEVPPTAKHIFVVVKNPNIRVQIHPDVH